MITINNEVSFSNKKKLDRYNTYHQNIIQEYKMFLIVNECYEQSNSITPICLIFDN